MTETALNVDMDVPRSIEDLEKVEITGAVKMTDTCPICKEPWIDPHTCPYVKAEEEMENCLLCGHHIDAIRVGFIDRVNLATAQDSHGYRSYPIYAHFTCYRDFLLWASKAMQSFRFSEKGMSITSTGDMKITAGEVQATVDADTKEGSQPCSEPTANAPATTRSPTV